MKRYNKLIFVDADDTCRAPMAKIIMRNKHLLGPLEIESRGLVVLFPEPLNQKAEAILISNGYKDNEQKSQQLMEADFDDTILVITMEDKDKEKIWSDYENAKNVYTLTEYVHKKGDVTSLYGEPLAGYGQCYEILEILIKDLVIQLNEEELTL